MPATSFSITSASRRAARRPYSGSSAVSSAAVRIDSSSSSRVVAPSYRPEMVRVATRIGSTACRPSQVRVTARTILLRSTGSRRPLRLVTLIVRLAAGGVRAKPGASSGARCAVVGDGDGRVGDGASTASRRREMWSWQGSGAWAHGSSALPSKVGAREAWTRWRTACGSSDNTATPPRARSRKGGMRVSRSPRLEAGRARTAAVLASVRRGRHAATPTVFPRRLLAGHRAVCIARLSAGLRTRDMTPTCARRVAYWSSLPRRVARPVQ